MAPSQLPGNAHRNILLTRGQWDLAISRGNVLMMRTDLLMDSGETQSDKTEFYHHLVEFVLVFTLS